MNFDFVPGDRVLFSDDYTGDNVGDFPRRLEFAEGNAEVADWEGGKWLRVSKSTKFTVALPETLPDRFTIEFDYVTNNKRQQRLADHAEHQRREDNWESQGNTIPTARFATDKGGVYAGKIEASEARRRAISRTR